MPQEKRIVQDKAPPTSPVGLVASMRPVPEPYDEQFDRVLNRLRARLFEMVELSMPAERLPVAKKQIRDFTSSAINDCRRLFLEAHTSGEVRG